MVADKGKKAKVAEGEGDEETENIDSELVLSIEKLQEIQDELEKVANLSLSLSSRCSSKLISEIEKRRLF